MTKIIKLAGIAALPALAAGWYLFRPELAFVDQKVSESVAADAKTVRSATFASYAHETTGTASIVQSGGATYVRLSGFKTSDEAGPPCRHMETMLQRTADGSAGFFTRAYAMAHAARCVRCGAFLNNLEVALVKLSESRDSAMPEDAMARLERRLEAVAEENPQA